MPEMTLRDEIKKQAEEIWKANELLVSKSDFLLMIEQALLERHNKSVEMAANTCEKPTGMVSRDYIRYAESTVAPEIRALRET